MEINELQDTTEADVPQGKSCINCGSEAVVEGHTNLLCAPCRKHFLKFPFPLWIKAFGAGIGVVVIFSLFSFFGNLQTGIHMARGEKAEQKHLYFTAQQEFEKVIENVPEHLEAKSHLLIASYYNRDLPVFIQTINELKGKNIDNQELYENTEEIINKESLLFPSDSLNALYERNTNTDGVALAAIVERYYEQNPADISAGYTVASNAIDNSEYGKAETILKALLEKDPHNVNYLTLMSVVKRHEKDVVGALQYLDHLLELNGEDLYALSSKARVMIMQSKDKEALKLAKKVERLNSSDVFNMATLAIVHHYLNDTKERDRLIGTARNSRDTSGMMYMQYAIDIVNNKETLRNN